MIRLVALACTLAGTHLPAATANPWHIVIDPVDKLGSLVAEPGLVVEFNTATDSYSELVKLVSPPVEVDGFHRVDDETFYFSINMHDNLLPQVAAPGDVFLFDTAEGSLTKVLDASAAGLPEGADVDAVTLAGNGDLVISVDTHVSLDGTVYEDADLIRYDGSSFSLFASADSLGLDDAADIDAAARFSHDRLVISTSSGGNASGINYRHNDLLLADIGSPIKRIELKLTEQAGTNSDLNALSGIALPDQLFQDRFEAD